MARLRITSWNDGRSSSVGSSTSASRRPGAAERRPPPPPRRSSSGRRGAGRPASARAAVSSATKSPSAGGDGAADARVRVGERGHQRVARVLASGLAERARRGGAHAPERIVAQRAGQRRDARRDRAGPASARAAATRSTASRAAASCRRHSAALLSSFTDLRTTSPGSKITWVGRAGRWNSKACVASLTRDAFVAARGRRPRSAPASRT